MLKAVELPARELAMVKLHRIDGERMVGGVLSGRWTEGGGGKAMRRGLSRSINATCGRT